MKSSRSDITRKAHRIPKLKFENQSLTSFAGLVLFQQFFAGIDLKSRLGSCFRHLHSGKVFGRQTIFLQLILHILLGYRELRDNRFYRDDPLVKRPGAPGSDSNASPTWPRSAACSNTRTPRAPRTSVGCCVR